MSNVWVRRLSAGTVKPETSPRARASYSDWMLADRAPSSWLASQTSHWAAAVVPSSVEKAAVQASSRIPASRKASWTSMTRRSPSRWAAPAIAARRSVGEVATFGIWTGSPAVTPMVATRSEGRLDHHQEDDRDDHDAEEHPTTLDLLDRGQQFGRRWARRGAGRGWRRRQLDQVMECVALDGQAVCQGDRIQDDRDQEPGPRHHVELAGQDEQHAGDPLEDGQRIQQPRADRLCLPRAEVRVLRLLARHRSHDRERECRAERDDRPEHMQ